MISLRGYVKSSVGNFLYTEQFPTNHDLPECILAMLDMISDYSEEGKVLFPELLITTDIEYITKTILSKHILIGEVELSPTAFRKALKQCAPLAGGDWVIYINFNNVTMSYGLITTELSETSITLQKQLIGIGFEPLPNVAFAFIKKKGIKSVELQGFNNNITVDFSLKETSESSSDLVHELCKTFDFAIDNPVFTNYYEKIISRSLKESHGALIGIVHDEQIQELKIKIPDGVYLKEPIDLMSILKIHEQDADLRYSYSMFLRVNAKAIQGMICSDGITVISTSGKIIAYNLFIDKTSNHSEPLDSPPLGRNPDKVVGGSRTRAFTYMAECRCFIAAFFKSQDGEERIIKL